MGKNGEACAGVYEETPVRDVVHDVDELAGGDGVEGPPAG
jgi:hypothetical protein